MLSQEQVNQFHQEGYTIAPSYFPAREARAMRLEMERLEKAGLGHNALPPTSRQENILFKALDEASPLYRALPFNDKLLADLSRLIGDPVLLWLDQIVLKPPRVGAGNVWHEDNARFKVPEVGRGVGVWIALHEANLANGTLEVVPCSHLGSRLENPSRRPTGEEEAQRVVAEMPAGGAAFFNFGVLHCTRDNETEAPRAAAVFHFLNGQYLPDEASLAYGRQILLSGPAASGGQREYGALVAGTWEEEVDKTLANLA